MTDEKQYNKDIALALSGGGSRAIAFHLGCLRALNDRGLLKRIKTISSVSGGSVIAAAYCLNKDDFQGFERRITAFLKQGLFRPTLETAFSPFGLLWIMSELIMLTLYLSWWFIRFILKTIRLVLCLIGIQIWAECKFRYRLKRPFTRTSLIERTLDKLLFDGLMLNDLPRDGPDLIVNATELTTGSAFRFSRAATGGWRFGRVIDDDIALAYAVAASAAYPVFLSHISDRFHFTRKDGSRHVADVTLTDGGIYDNLGLGPLWPDRSSEVSLNVDPSRNLICCSAGYGLRADEHPSYWIGRMMQSFYTTFDRAQNAAINQMHALKTSEKIDMLIFPYLGMLDQNLPNRPADLVPRERVHAYPTDFFGMSDENIRLIGQRGEQLTHHLLEIYGQKLLHDTD